MHSNESEVRDKAAIDSRIEGLPTLVDQTRVPFYLIVFALSCYLKLHHHLT